MSKIDQKNLYKSKNTLGQDRLALVSAAAFNFPKANVLIFKLEDDSRIAIRPSGTEPKIKFYFSVNAKMDINESWQELEKKLDKRIKAIIQTLNL